MEQVPDDYDPFGVGKGKKRRKKKGMGFNMSGENWDFAKINKQKESMKRVEEEQKNAYEMAKTPARNIHKGKDLDYDPVTD